MSHLASVRLRLVLAGMFVLVCCAVGLALWARQVVEQSRERISAIRETVVNEAAQQRAGASDDAPVVGPAPEVIRQTCTQLGDLERDLKPVAELASVAAPASGLIGQIPQVGERAAALLTLAQAAGDISGSLRLGCDALEPVVQAQAASSDTASLVESLVAGLGASRDQLRQASARLRLAQARLATVDERQLDEPTRRFLVDLRTRLPSAIARLELASELPRLLGHDGPRTFLMLGQNSDELRPTGGFIGTSGLITFDRGRLIWKEYGSSFGLNVPADRLVRPPEPLRRYMGAGYWHLQEANWWPDFPSSAQQARYFYNVVRDGQLAGVFALDQDLMVLLVGVTGPIDVPEYGEVVSADNVRERLDYHVHVVGAGPEKSRKGFVSSLFSALIDRLNTLPRDRARVLTAALDRGLAEQHLLLWADDPDAQQPIAALGWDGRMLSTSGDYLFPVSANVGMNKVNREVEQDLAYDISQDFDGRLVGHASLRIGNRRASDDPGPYATADYRDFFRLYVPAQSELVSAAGFAAEPQAEIECGRTVFSGLVVVRPGEERRVELVYRLPAMLDPSAYSLVIQKQPGTSAFPVRLRGLGIPAGDLAFQLAGSQR
ncbi:MAG TPA: DUF4012 domain-containing protein, partial [Chloroflexota bacterium]|nr:DUF4012 domain-containing protein [Chloroflexota bacterium]